MTERVDFYVLKSAAARSRHIFACRLAEKAYLRDLSVVVLSEDSAAAAALDELMWTFDERSFVPHELGTPPGTAAGQSAAAPAPVHLVADLDAVGRADLLLNLSTRLPADLARFTRIAEILDADSEGLRLGRERFKAYRDLTLPLETHHLDEGREA